MGLLDGKVALITGGARGQGRAHAVTSAREGADIILVDTLDQLASVPYPMATQQDLDETLHQVEALDRRAVTVIADVRSQDQLDAAVTRGIAELGQIDILIANAGIWTQAPFWELSEQSWEEGECFFHALKGRSFLPPEVIADTAPYLNSHLAAAVTGVTIPVDAGHVLLTGVNPAPVR